MEPWELVWESCVDAPSNEDLLALMCTIIHKELNLIVAVIFKKSFGTVPVCENFLGNFLCNFLLIYYFYFYFFLMLFCRFYLFIND